MQKKASCEIAAESSLIFRPISLDAQRHSGYLLILISLLWSCPPDTLYVAWPCTVSASVAEMVPEAERLGRLPGGRLVLRYWEAPQAQPSSEGAAIVVVFPALPDTGYPKPDFAVPPLPIPEPEENSSLFLWPLLLAALLGVVLFHRAIGAWLRLILSRLYWRLRWEAFLLKYPPARSLPLAAYAQALFQLLMPYCDFHPGSLLPAETTSLSGPLPFQLLFQKLLPPLYQERFLRRPLPPASLQNLRKELYILLRQARPYAGTPQRHRLWLSS